MTRMTGPDCVVMCNLINTHTHTHTHTLVVDRSCLGQEFEERRRGRSGRYLQHISPEKTKHIDKNKKSETPKQNLEMV